MNIGSNMNNIYRRIITDLMEEPDRIGTTRKGERVYERFNYAFTLMNPLDSFCDIRGTSWEYLTKEFEFYASGSDLVADAVKLSKFWSRCTDNGVTINSNYGKLLMHDRNAHGKTQIQHVLDCLINNPQSKKAVAVIYGPENGYISNDNPCTMFLHFIILGDQLNCIAYMRSNDIWFGTVYDVPYFCSVMYTVHQMLLRPLKDKYGLELKLGNYTHHACNLHFYERNLEQLKAVIDKCAEGVALRKIEDLYNITLRAAYDYAVERVNAPLSAADYIHLAWLESADSPCLKKKCGAILVDGYGQIIGSGYGGREYGECKSCARDVDEVFYSDGCFSVHAEMRAIFAAIKNHPKTNWGKATMYTTHGPCDACMKLMDYVGIRTVVYDVPYKTNYNHYPRVRVLQERVRTDVAGKHA